MTPTVPVVNHAINWIERTSGKIGHACCIYATAPFITADDIRDARRALEDKSVSGYVFSATSFGFPIQRAFRINKGGFCKMFHPENYNIRSQDLEPAYQDAGQFYWGRADAFRQAKPFFAEDSMPFLIPRHRVQDIDTMEDWHRAELMFKVLREAQSFRESTPQGGG
jgi:CMP-N-acetylneuraminic acid synthetase